MSRYIPNQHISSQHSGNAYSIGGLKGSLRTLRLVVLTTFIFCFTVYPRYMDAEENTATCKEPLLNPRYTDTEGNAD